MKLYFQTYWAMLTGLLERPMWLMLMVSLCVMSTVYVHRTVWDLPVAVVDQDHSTASRLLIRHFDATPKIALRGYDNLNQALHDLGWRKVFAVIIVPQDLEQKMLAGKAVTIPVFGDATNRLSSGQIQQDVLTAYRQMLMQYESDLLQRHGFNERQAQVVLQPFVGQTEDLYNPGISFAAIVFPGLLVMLLQHSLLIATVRVNIGLRAKGKPLFPAVLGALTALITIWLFLSIVLFVLWPWLLGYRQTASIAVILFLTFPFLLAVLGLGRLLTECLRSVERIYLTLSLSTMPVFYISGTIWPVQAMPGWVRCISSLLPSTWATKMIAGVNQMQLPLPDVMGDYTVLLLLGAGYATLGFLIALLQARGHWSRIRWL